MLASLEAGTGAGDGALLGVLAGEGVLAGDGLAGLSGGSVTLGRVIFRLFPEEEPDWLPLPLGVAEEEELSVGTPVVWPVDEPAGVAAKAGAKG